MIIRDVTEVRSIYAEAAKKGWVMPCFCTENLATTEAILTAAEAFRVAHSLPTLPVILAITGRYDHRSQLHHDPPLGHRSQALYRGYQGPLREWRPV